MKYLSALKKVHMLAMLIGVMSIHHTQGQNYLGVKGGLTLYQHHLSGEIGAQQSASVTGLTAGLMFESRFYDTRFSIQPEINFIQKGSSVTDSLGNGDTRSAKWKVHYAEIPILFKYRLGTEAAFVHVFAGPGVGYAFSGKREVEIQSGQGVEITDTRISFQDEHVGRLDINANLGAAAHVGLPNGSSLFADLRWQIDFMDMETYWSNVQQYNRGFQLTIGYLHAL
jgi:hypothetical protein